MIRALLICSLYNISSFRRLSCAIAENIAYYYNDGLSDRRLSSAIAENIAYQPVIIINQGS